MGPGTVVGGRYRLAERIGSGSMGAVHRAVDELLGRDVAVKLIASRARTAEERQRDEAEAKVLSQLNHHSLITLFDAGTEVSPSGTSIVWLAMELVQGPDLSRRLAKGKLPARQVSHLGYDVSIGLDYMHRAGIVHRDVKPANILLFDYREDESRLRAKLTDFGVAQMAGDPTPQSDGFTGTAGFMSPEQVRSEPAGPHSDVYSLGLVLLRCLTGERAFPGMAVESALARLFRGPAIPDSLGPAWTAILKAMTAPDTDERPSAHEVSEAMMELATAGRGRRSVVADPDRVRAAEELAAESEDGPDPVLDRITAITARVLDVPVAAISIVGAERVWTMSGSGTSRGSADASRSLCPVTVSQDAPFIVDDVQGDPRTSDVPLVAASPGFGFYAGIPLRNEEGLALGTLCVMDREARSLTGEQESTLRDLAALASDVLQLRQEAREAQDALSRDPAVAD
ncbi:protein kinase domain-containing protein [Arthrobacter gandavensis]|uniref:protein kinase domain-containing protein n=1 Tax=Arthrobacter gandavensis TaxID=169960 RepID=UPI001E451BE0|nr:GAF domain-containing serine/threonine-protein kinase [Arthrobacter gandavensis]